MNAQNPQDGEEPEAIQFPDSFHVCSLHREHPVLSVQRMLEMTCGIFNMRTGSSHVEDARKAACST